MVAWIPTILSSLGVLLIALGLAARRRPRRHVPLMLSAFAVDLVAVVVIEVLVRAREGQGAVEEGYESLFGGAWGLLDLHIVASLLAAVCYVVAIVTGRRLLRRGEGRRVHRANAACFLFFRLVNYVTSFFIP